MDVHSPEQRRYNMSQIRGKNTRPELLVRRGLHSAGLRFRLHVKELPGRPDLVFPRFKTAVMVNGCFWHGHDCPLFRMPHANADFWHAKIIENRKRDKRNLESLTQAGWRTLIIWECSLKGRSQRPLDELLVEATIFIRGSTPTHEIAGFSSTSHFLP